MSNAPVMESTPREAYHAVTTAADAHLVDVRTRAEWAYVGLPVLGSQEPILLEWQKFPEMTVDEGFGPALQRACPDPQTALYFLCRSGVRSLAAAQLMSRLGYTRVFNVLGGFEGPPDDAGHRGALAGWKAEGLPWRQS